MNTIPPEYLNQIITGDARELAKCIPDESVDLIFTDPPYPREFLPLYEWLAETAARVLKPGGLLITLSGNMYFDIVFSMLSKHLLYHWCGGMPHNNLGATTQIHPRQMMSGWKPMLWFSKGAATRHAYVFDFWNSPIDKRYHDWGQPVQWGQYYIDKLTILGELILDPFAGGGTVPAICKILRRNYIAFEIVPEVAERARERVRNTQPPLFVLQPEQSAMEFAEA